MARAAAAAESPPSRSGLPMTTTSAPAATASAGVATRAWSPRAAPGRPDAGDDEQRPGTDGGADRRHLVGRADEPVGPRSHREARQPDHGVGRRPGQPDAAERRVVEAREHRDGEHLEPSHPRRARRPAPSPRPRRRGP